MALSVDELNATTQEFFVDSIVQQAYDSHFLFDRLKKKNHVRWDGGVKIRFPIRYRKLDLAKSIDPDTTRIPEKKATRTAGELDWKYYVVDVVMSWDDSVKNAGKEQVINLMSDRLNEALEDIFDQWTEHLYQAAASKATKDIDGLLTIAQQPSGATTYAGISGGTGGDAVNWGAGFYNSSTTALTLYGSNSLDAGIRGCTFGFENAKPDLLVTTRAIASIYASKLQPSERRVPGNGESGATDIAFQDIPFIADPACLAGDIHILNTKYMYLYVSPGYDFSIGGWAEDQLRYNAVINNISWAGNLVCTRRRSQGAFTAITS